MKANLKSGLLNRNISRVGEQSNDVGVNTGDVTGQFGENSVIFPDNETNPGSAATQGAPRLNPGGQRISMQGHLSKRGSSRPVQIAETLGAQPFQVPDFAPEEIPSSKFRVAFPSRGKTARNGVSGQHWQEASK
jgi:hypothetical protein